MPIETGTTIADLDDSYPLGDDPTSEGDNHLRLIKAVLKAQFPGVDGDGYKEAILATEQELNWLSGLTDNVQVQLDALSTRLDELEGQLSAPQDTALAFWQASAPPGWTQDTTLDDMMLRVVGVSGGLTGGTDSPIIMDKVPSHTHETGDSTHSHTFSMVSSLAYYPNTSGTSIDTSGHYHNNFTTDPETHSHTVLANENAASWEPKYADMIICIKD